jgi:hypothetical protein
MADYWRNLAVPDAIGRASPQARTDENEQVQPDWFSILSGGDSRPNLNIQRSQEIPPNIQRTWDVDSLISWASCLSITRGLYVSYHPPVSRNFGSSIHVFHYGTALHLIPHLRLGSRRQSPQFSVYVFFPGISHVCRTTTYLTKEERRMWIDQLLLPAIRRCCPPDVIQHHPRSFDDVESKAYSRQRETCGGMVPNRMDMHHYLPQEYLPAIWRHMTQNTEQADLAVFRGMFIVLSAKNIKLEAKSSTFQECAYQDYSPPSSSAGLVKSRFVQYMGRCWSRRHCSFREVHTFAQKPMFGVLGPFDEVQRRQAADIVGTLQLESYRPGRQC